MSLSLEQMCLRIFVAFLVGTVVGIERTLMKKPAGMRTHALVCIICTMLTIVSAYGFEDFVGVNKDPARLISNILTGIGFLCGGVIYIVTKEQEKIIKGLTTAAGIWGVAGLGIPIGLGHYQLVLICVIAIEFTLKFEGMVKKAIIKLHKKNPNSSGSFDDFFNEE